MMNCLLLLLLLHHLNRGRDNTTMWVVQHFVWSQHKHFVMRGKLRVIDLEGWVGQVMRMEGIVWRWLLVWVMLYWC